MFERNAEQKGVNRSETADANRTSDPEAPVEAFLAEHPVVVEEYADGDYSTAWLIEALLSWAECDGRTNEVTEQ